jgi:hypothetical protein
MSFGIGRFPKEVEQRHGPVWECVGKAKRVFHKLGCIEPTIGIRLSDKALHLAKPSGLPPSVPNFGIICCCKHGDVRGQVLQTFGLDCDYPARTFNQEV